MATNSSNTCIDAAVFVELMNKDEYHKEPQIETKKALPPGTSLTIGINVSGNPVRSISKENDNIVFELLAVMNLLYRLGETFYFNGVNFGVYVYSDSIKRVMRGRLEETTISGMYTISSLVGRLLEAVTNNYTNKETNFLSFFDVLSENERWINSNNVKILILTTNGVSNIPNDQEASFLRNLGYVSDHTKNRLFSFIIGRDAAYYPQLTGLKNNSVLRFDDREISSPNDFLPILGLESINGTSLEFLFLLSTFLGKSVYIPANQDYERFYSVVDTFLNEQTFIEKETTWVVVLPNRYHKLEDRIVSFLNKGKVCASYSDVTNLWYLFVPNSSSSGWQTILSGENTLNTSRVYNVPDKRLNKISYKDSLSRSSTFTVKINQQKMTIALDQDGHWHSKQLVVISV